MNYKQLISTDVAQYSSAFTKNIFAHHDSARYAENDERQLIVRVLCPRVEKNQCLLIAGNCDELGNWNPLHAKEMRCVNFPEWEIRLSNNKIVFPLEYKFIIADHNRQNCLWEYGENRLLSSLHEEKNEVSAIDAHPFRDPRPAWKGAGTVIPVFSLRSEQSFGIGDMHDLKLLVDWAKQTNQCVIQLLPMNDTTTTYTDTDSYPYSAISIYALHPVYISLSEMGALKDAKQARIYQRWQKQLNEYKTADYKRVLKHKLRFCRLYYKQEKENIFNDTAFGSFYRNNRDWLEPYALFCYFRDNYKTADFKRWRKNAVYDPQMAHLLLATSDKARSEMIFTIYLQYVLHTQFKAVADYAREQGVILKGDLPIGISRTSVEAWIESSYFNFDMQAGAPPDFFSATGQTWSFPTYNWAAMEKDGYTWWKKRFRKLSDYFDAFRIDHILGFFRIWEIPREHTQGLYGHFRPALPLSVEEIEQAGFPFDIRFVEPANEALFMEDPYEKGKYHPRILASQTCAFQALNEQAQSAYQKLSDDFFYERHNEFWKAEALKRLTPLVNCTDMLICGEDLGMIPKPVQEVMDELHILSLELERAPKVSGIDFTNLQTVPYLSVCTTSTHDMEPLREWWKVDRQKTQHYYQSVLHRAGDAPDECGSELAELVIMNHLHASSMLTIIPLQDWFALSDALKRTDTESERINIPETPNYIWDYRMHITLEQLLHADDLNQKIRKMIASSGR